MDKEEIKKILCQQLLLLAEASKKETDSDNLCEMTEYILTLAERVAYQKLSPDGYVISSNPQQQEEINQILMDQAKLLLTMSESTESGKDLCNLTQHILLLIRQITLECFYIKDSTGKVMFS